MNIRTKRKISALVTALIFLCLWEKTADALPLTDTVYTITEENFEFIFREEVHRVNDYYRKERIGMGFGILPRFSFWLMADYLHRGIADTSEDVMGDMLLKLWYYAGDYAGNTLHLGFKLQFRIPSGPDVYGGGDWSSLALGRHELEAGVAGKYDILPRLFLHFNLDYIFRQGNNESFYGGFHVNPVSADTYRTLLGLNPFAHDAFLSGPRLKNDFMNLACALNTDGIYPFIPYFEASWSFRLYRGKIMEDDIPMEGGAVEPFLLSLGGRWFFTRSLYVGFYAVVNPVWNDNFTKAVFGVDMGVEF